MFRLLKMMFELMPRWIKTVEANGMPATAIIVSLPEEVETLKGGKVWL
jgi:hypothetical protein